MTTDGSESLGQSFEILVGATGNTEPQLFEKSDDSDEGGLELASSDQAINLLPQWQSGTADQLFATLVDLDETGSQVVAEQDEALVRARAKFYAFGSFLLEPLRKIDASPADTCKRARNVYSDFQKSEFQNFHPDHLFDLAASSFNAHVLGSDSQDHLLREQGHGWSLPSGALEFSQLFVLLRQIIANLAQGYGTERTPEMYERMEAFVRDLMNSCQTAISAESRRTERLTLLEDGAELIADLAVLRRQQTQ